VDDQVEGQLKEKYVDC